MKTQARLLVLCLAILMGVAIAQQTAQQSAPASQPITATVPPTGFVGLDRYRAGRANVFFNDYGELARYRAANAALPPPVAGENRVVFFGDSITDIWKLDESFPGKPYVNRGIGGQTTSQMLVRFRQDVINLKPKVVVILAGTNDIAGNSGPIANEDIQANYADFAELARANNVRLIFASVLPVSNYTDRSKDFFAQRPISRILELNKWLKAYCEKNHLIYLDYFSAMVDDKGMLKRELADDGLHPNKAGFAVMEPMAEKAIDKALGDWKSPLAQRSEYQWLPRYMRDQNQLPKGMFTQAPRTARHIEAFRSLTHQMTMAEVVRKCGVPDELQGSGIEIFIYHMKDGSIVVIGTTNIDEGLMYARHVKPDQETVSLLD